LRLEKASPVSPGRSPVARVALDRCGATLSAATQRVLNGCREGAVVAGWTALGAAAAVSLLAAVGLAGDALAAGRATPAGARSVAVEFFRSQNERRYEDTCRLLSGGFYERHGLRDRRTCAGVLRVAFAWSGRIDFRIGGIRREGDRVVVEAVAEGAPGRILLVRERGRLRILAVEGT
jgi:hypothetical protein